MIERIILSVTTMIRELLMRIGHYGSIQMCAGFFHEIQVPEELQQQFEKNL